MKSFTKPPPLVETVLAAVMVLFGQKTDWATAKKKIGEADFLTQVATMRALLAHVACLPPEGKLSVVMGSKLGLL